VPSIVSLLGLRASSASSRSISPDISSGPDAGFPPFSAASYHIRPMTSPSRPREVQSRYMLYLEHQQDIAKQRAQSAKQGGNEEKTSHPHQHQHQRGQIDMLTFDEELERVPWIRSTCTKIMVPHDDGSISMPSLPGVAVTMTPLPIGPGGTTIMRPATSSSSTDHHHPHAHARAHTAHATRSMHPSASAPVLPTVTTPSLSSSSVLASSSSSASLVTGRNLSPERLTGPGTAVSPSSATSPPTASSSSSSSSPVRASNNTPKNDDRVGYFHANPNDYDTTAAASSPNFSRHLRSYNLPATAPVAPPNHGPIHTEPRRLTAIPALQSQRALDAARITAAQQAMNRAAGIAMATTPTRASSSSRTVLAKLVAGASSSPASAAVLIQGSSSNNHNHNNNGRPQTSPAVMATSASAPSLLPSTWNSTNAAAATVLATAASMSMSTSSGSLNTFGPTYFPATAAPSINIYTRINGITGAPGSPGSKSQQSPTPTILEYHPDAKKRELLFVQAELKHRELIAALTNATMTSSTAASSSSTNDVTSTHAAGTMTSTSNNNVLVRPRPMSAKPIGMLTDDAAPPSPIAPRPRALDLSHTTHDDDFEDNNNMNKDGIGMSHEEKVRAYSAAKTPRRPSAHYQMSPLSMTSSATPPPNPLPSPPPTTGAGVAIIESLSRVATSSATKIRGGAPESPRTRLARTMTNGHLNDDPRALVRQRALRPDGGAADEESEDEDDVANLSDASEDSLDRELRARMDDDVKRTKSSAATAALKDKQHKQSSDATTTATANTGAVSSPILRASKSPSPPPAASSSGSIGQERKLSASPTRSPSPGSNGNGNSHDGRGNTSGSQVRRNSRAGVAGPSSRHPDAHKRRPSVPDLGRPTSDHYVTVPATISPLHPRPISAGTNAIAGSPSSTLIGLKQRPSKLISASSTSSLSHVISDAPRSTSPTDSPPSGSHHNGNKGHHRTGSAPQLLEESTNDIARAITPPPKPDDPSTPLHMPIQGAHHERRMSTLSQHEARQATATQGLPTPFGAHPLRITMNRRGSNASQAASDAALAAAVDFASSVDRAVTMVAAPALDLEHVDPSLADAPPTPHSERTVRRRELLKDRGPDVRIERWLRGHGKLMRRKVHPREKVRYRRMFDMLDNDGSGAVDLTEIYAAMTHTGLKASKDELMMIVQVADRNSDGELNFDEFISSFTSLSEWDRLYRLWRKRKDESNAEPTLPFTLWVPAFHRQCVMERAMTGHVVKDDNPHTGLVAKLEVPTELADGLTLSEKWQSVRAMVVAQQQADEKVTADHKQALLDGANRKRSAAVASVANSPLGTGASLLHNAQSLSPNPSAWLHHRRMRSVALLNAVAAGHALSQMGILDPTPRKNDSSSPSSPSPSTLMTPTTTSYSLFPNGTAKRASPSGGSSPTLPVPPSFSPIVPVSSSSSPIVPRVPPPVRSRFDLVHGIAH
jgi:hypothetical protein